MKIELIHSINLFQNFYQKLFFLQFKNYKYLIHYLIFHQSCIEIFQSKRKLNLFLIILNFPFSTDIITRDRHTFMLKILKEYSLKNFFGNYALLCFQNFENIFIKSKKLTRGANQYLNDLKIDNNKLYCQFCSKCIDHQKLSTVQNQFEIQRHIQLKLLGAQQQTLSNFFLTKFKSQLIEDFILIFINVDIAFEKADIAKQFLKKYSTIS
ncbi:hypothetical protein ABPG72_002607 [Tetrahymena utriculariae]